MRNALSQAVLAACLMLGASVAVAQAPAGPAAQAYYDIPAGTLDQVLNRFASSAGFMLVIDATLTSGKTSPGLSGSHTPREGLATILADSGLEAVQQAGGGYSLRRAPEARSGRQLDAVLVRGARETATGPANGYLATRSATATKSDTELMDTPASVSVVTQQQIEAQATRTIGEALRYVPGVAVEFDGVDSRFDTIAFRGFDAGSTTWLDGIKLEGGVGSGNNWTLPQVDPYTLERIEVLKGPASVIYGQVVPGGMVNMVSKRPTRDPIGNIDLTVGSPEQKRLGVDLGGALGDSGVAAWRLLALSSDADSHMDYVERKRTMVAPSVKLPLGENGEITLMGSFQRDRGGSDYAWLPAYGTLYDNPNGEIPLSRFIGEPGFDRYDRDQDIVGWSVEYDMNDSWTLRQNLRAQRIKTTMESVTSDMYGAGDPAEWGWDGRTIDRYANRGIGTARALGVDTQSEWRISVGEAKHTLLAGIDYHRSRFDAQRETADVGPAGSAGAFDLYAPVYGAQIGAFSPLSAVDSKSRQTGFYLQDQVEWGKWRLVGGIRHDRSTISGSTEYRGSGELEDIGQRDSATTGRLGALYRFDSGWAPYISYATSFEPVAGATAEGSPFEPMRGKQTEIGIKYQPTGAKWMASLAVFDLRQTNRLTDDPVHGYPDQVQTGEVRSRGLELSVTGRLSPNWSVIGSYAYLDTEVTDSEIPEELGKPALYVPKHQASLWVDYTVTGQSALAGTVMGVGIRHVGSSHGGDIEAPSYASIKIPSHTVADLRIATQLRRLSPAFGDSELALNVTNITDKRYVNGCGSLWTCGWGLGRQVSLTFSGRF
ncbi:TonB-dependent siderophore receptor [Pusillimonas sp. SM2304]|uniref:TonB-dependent siderophore receptor n=1 Tax=Pusillimonas sp. SM2304 TaxID=3073241 RepID=UPI002874DC4F|nr:TonB-dependent siderophore receptor [Pusillimonas sp. SM2304]MDS1139475.1 TonB-dependent siderophore receptor [Pusillimonas sp. SM2304]